VTNNCTISTAALAFGSYDPVVAHASANLDGSGTVIVACTKGAVATVGLGLGSNASGSTRRMTNGASEFLTYELYQDAGRTTVWGNAGAGLYSPGAAPSKTARNFTVYGRVAANQDVVAGNYSDTVVATVNF
jgi:spore coat protein U-like protein